MKKLVLLLWLLIGLSTVHAQLINNPTASSSLAISRTGGVLTFDKYAIYNSNAVPFNGAITLDFTGAIPNTYVSIYYNAPSFTPPSPAVIRGGQAYNPGQINILTFLYRSNTDVDVFIFSTATGSYINPETKLVATGTTTTSTTPGNISGLTTTLALNAKYLVSADLMVQCDGAGGVKLASVFPTLTGINYLLADGATSNTTYGRQPLSATAGATAFAAVASTTRFPVRVMGYIETTTDGAFALQFSSTTSGQQSTVFIGSNVTLFRIQ